MPKKAYKKKRAYKAACREKARQGLMNHADGTFKPARDFADDGMRRDYFAGYKLGKVAP